ncbi:hypothetical protein [Acinetobacter nosocomialis]|uniref:hypothetical protein n=1 Tax=Acinetobacter nosocomialis TaxID=106654 RepID=UPI0029DA4B97|nr:hypothetical protein [Acinetobacter nosocomialis]MDX7880469.1 hypothetical protein [Acinetobacter nosocomialis]
MVIYEMIFRSNPEDLKSDFYKNNTEETRKYFFEHMLRKADQELDKYKSHDLSEWMLEPFEETIRALNSMKDEFIKTGNANCDFYQSIGVLERTINEI